MPTEHEDAAGPPVTGKRQLNEAVLPIDGDIIAL